MSRFGFPSPSRQPDYRLSSRWGPKEQRPRGSANYGRILVALVIAGMALLSYFRSQSHNEITGETQYIGISEEQEVALGLQSAPEMAEQYGGASHDAAGRREVERVGRRLLQHSDAGQRADVYEFSFTLLADPQTVNAFALPGGPVFITEGLYTRLQTEDQLAGVLGHEIGHVVARHGAQRIAKQQLTQGLTGSLLMATYDPSNPNSQQAAAVAQMIGGLINMKYGRDEELQSDRLGVRFMAQAGYDPHAMIDVMHILEEAGGGGNQPEFFSTHPNPENRIAEIEQAIRELPESPEAGRSRQE